MSSQLIYLDVSQVVTDRPFTYLDHSLADMTTLQYMAETLCQLLMHPGSIPGHPRPLVLYQEEACQAFHRMALVRPEALLKPNDLTVVGFCGQKRLGVGRGPIDAVDDELIAELPQFPDILSYSTLRLRDGNSCNLVLFSRIQGIAHWSISKKHTVAVQMSSDYYQSIRLHNAVLHGGLMSNNKLVLLRTKYLDFRDKPAWRAIREVTKPE